MDFKKTLFFKLIIFCLAFLFFEEVLYDAGYSWGIFYELVMAIGASFLVLWVFILQIKKEIRFSRWVLLFLLLLMAGGIIGSLSARESTRSWADFFVWLGAIVIFFVLSQIADYDLLKKAVWFFAAFAFAFSIYGLTLFLARKQDVIFSRAVYPLLNPDVLSGYLLGLWWIVAALLFGGNFGKKVKAFLFVALLSAGTLFVLTISYTAFAAFVPTAGFFVYFFRDKIFNKKTLLLILLAAVLTLAGAVTFRYAFGLSLKESFSIYVTRGNAAISGGNRLQYFASGAKVFFDHIFTGIGFRNYVYFYFQNPVNINELPNSTHWNFLDIAMSTGILGIIGFLGFVVWTFIKNFRAARTKKELYFVAVFLAWVAVTIQGAIEYNWEVKALVLNFLIFAGLMEGVWLTAASQNGVTIIQNAQRKIWVLAAAMISALLLFLKSGQIFLASNYLMLGDKQYSRGNYENARLYYEKAWAVEKRSEIGFSLINAKYALAQKEPGASRWAEAEGAAKEAVSRWPHYFESYSVLGNIYESEGKLRSAADQYEKAVELNPKIEIMLQIDRARANFELGEFKKVIADTEDYVDFFQSQDQPEYFATSQSAAWKKSADTAPIKLSLLLYYQGEAYLNLGNQRGALLAFKRALSLYPDLAEAKAELAKIKGN